MKSLERIIARKAGRAIGDYGLVEHGDRVLVALSGGKDSWTLLHVLDALRRRAPVSFSIIAVTVHPGFPGFRSDDVEAYLKGRGFEYHIERSDMYGVITEKMGPEEEGWCAFCARLRRGILYRLAGELSATKVALGHHADDLIETLLMSAFYNGELRSMPPKLLAEDGRNVVIRPLCYVSEKEITEFVMGMDFPVITCGCPVCGGSAMKRHKVKAMLNKLEAENPGVKDSMLAALGNIKPKYLMDKRFY